MTRIGGAPPMLRPESKRVEFSSIRDAAWPMVHDASELQKTWRYASLPSSRLKGEPLRMPEAEVYRILLWTMYGLAAVTFVVLQFIAAPYGRHQTDGWGPTVPNRVGWIVMESPALGVFLAVFLLGDAKTSAAWVMLGFWFTHYVQRTLIFPFLTRTSGKRMPVLVMASAFAFNILNAYLNARWISHFGEYGATWLTDPRFILGGLIFVAGYVMNIYSDRILFRLRKPGESGYKVPRGGLYRWVSSPNYLSECVEWFGWALLTWSFPGLGFAVYTLANLLPRALENHRWYKERFDDYPEDRKALVPFVL